MATMKSPTIKCSVCVHTTAICNCVLKLASSCAIAIITDSIAMLVKSYSIVFAHNYYISVLFAVDLHCYNQRFIQEQPILTVSAHHSNYAGGVITPNLCCHGPIGDVIDLINHIHTYLSLHWGAICMQICIATKKAPAM